MVVRLIPVLLISLGWLFPYRQVGAVRLLADLPWWSLYLDSSQVTKLPHLPGLRRSKDVTGSFNGYARQRLMLQ